MDQKLNHFINSNNSGTPTGLGSYYSSVMALTPKRETTISQLPTGVQNTPIELLFTPYLGYITVGLFFIFFLGGILLQTIHKLLDLKRTMASIMVAFILAIMPVSLKTALEVTSFQSRAGIDEIPYNIKIIQSTTNAFTITWATSSVKRGALRFSPTPLNEKSSQVVIADGGKNVSKHTAVIKNLKAGVEYEFEILSGSGWYNNLGKPIKFKLNSP